MCDTLKDLKTINQIELLVLSLQEIDDGHIKELLKIISNVKMYLLNKVEQ